MDNPPPIIALEQYLTKMRTIEDLARELDVSCDYLTAMKHHGFKLPGGKASIRMAQNFLATCDTFKVRASRSSTKRHQGKQPPSDVSSDK